MWVGGANGDRKRLDLGVVNTQHSIQMVYYKLYTWNLYNFINLFLKLYLFLERVERKEKERERNTNVWLPPTCLLLGTWPATQACALTGNQTGDPLVHKPALNPLSYTSQGPSFLFLHLLDSHIYTILLAPMDIWVCYSWEQSTGFFCNLKTLIYYHPVIISRVSLTCCSLDMIM